MATPKQTDPQFKLRLPQDLKDRIEEAAQTNNRSLNAEMVDRLEFSFHSEGFLNRSYERQEHLTRLLNEEQVLFDYMHKQQKLSMRMMEYIVRKGGQVDPAFVEILKEAIENKGNNPEFPFDNEGNLINKD